MSTRMRMSKNDTRRCVPPSPTSEKTHTESISEAIGDHLQIDPDPTRTNCPTMWSFRPTNLAFLVRASYGQDGTSLTK